MKLGDRLDALGVEADLEDADLVAGALVLLHVVQSDGTEMMVIAESDGLGRVTSSGMVAGAFAIHQGAWHEHEEG